MPRWKSPHPRNGSSSCLSIRWMAFLASIVLAGRSTTRILASHISPEWQIAFNNSSMASSLCTKRHIITPHKAKFFFLLNEEGFRKSRWYGAYRHIFDYEGFRKGEKLRVYTKLPLHYPSGLFGDVVLDVRTVCSKVRPQLLRSLYY